MKKILLISVCVVALSTNGFAQQNLKGEKGVSSVGVNIGYAIESERAVIGVDYRYNIFNRVRIAPSILYAVQKDNSDIWYFNADVHYLARITNKITLYPLGGLGVSSWAYKLPNIELPGKMELNFDSDLDLVIKSREIDTHFGLNLGFGSEIRLTKDIIVGAEFRYNLTKHYFNQAMLLARIAYYF